MLTLADTLRALEAAEAELRAGDYRQLAAATAVAREARRREPTCPAEPEPDGYRYVLACEPLGDMRYRIGLGRRVTVDRSDATRYGSRSDWQPVASEPLTADTLTEAREHADRLLRADIVSRRD